MLIQCTKKLLDELNIKPSLSAEEEPLFSWHANLLTLNRRKTVILVNDKNRYVIVLYGLKAKDFKKLDELILQAVCEAFREEGIKDEIIENYSGYSGKIVYARTKDRTSVARMNKSCEPVYYDKDLLCDKFICQSDLSMRASSCLVGNGKDYINPNEELLKDLKEFSGQSVLRCRAAVLKVTLNLERYKVWRRIVIPLNKSFVNLHRVLQHSFGWQDCHLHEFYIYGNEADSNFSDYDYINDPAYNKEGFKPIVNLVCSDDALEYPNDIKMRLEENIKLSEYIPQYKRLIYNYDFGDNWQHFIEVENIIDDYESNHPVCLAGEGNTPPEDVGGEPGYEEFLEIINDVNHPEYADMSSWGKSQGYKEFNIDNVNREIRYI